MNASSMATPQVPASSCETTPGKLPENAANISSESPLATAAPSGQQPQQPTGTRMLPLLYIQGPAGMRVGTSSAGTMPVSTTSTGTQVVSSAIKPQFVTTNTQFIPALAPKLAMAPVVASSTISPASVVTTTASSSKLVPATLDQQQTQQQPPQPHFVIQTPRTPAGSTATIVPVSVSGPGIAKHTFAYLGTIIKPGVGVGKPCESPQLVLPTAGLVPATNQKLLLAPVPVLPQLAPKPPPTGNTTKPPQSQQPKVASLLLPMSIPAAVGGGKSGMINLKISNGQIHTEGKGSVTVLREAKPLAGTVGQLPPLQPIAKYPGAKTTSMKANGLLLPDCTTLTPLKDAAPAALMLPKKPAIDDETSTKKSSTTNNNNNNVNNNNNINNNNNNNNNNTNNNSDDKRKLNQDLNRCLKETVDAIFSPNSPTLIKDNERNKMSSADDEVTLIKVNPLKDESAIKEETKKEIPEDDVKIEIVKQDIKTEQIDANAEDFDPMKVLEWKDGIGTLPGSNLKFCMNEFGMMEVVDDEEYEKLMSSKKNEAIKDEPTAPVSIPDVESDAGGKKDEDDEGTDNRSDSKNDQATKPSGTSDDIYCCEGCGCYGLASEFVSSRFCSHTCASSFASKKAAQTKKERDLLQLRLRRRKKRLLHLMQQQLQSQQQQASQQGDSGKVQTSAAPSASRQSTSTVTSSSVPASSKPQILSEEENMSNDGTQDASKPQLPWQTGKSGFSWSKYLEHCKAKAAPTKLFKDPFPYSKNGFKVGMKMEGIDPEHPSYYCVLTVTDVQGYRIRLHFDGYSDNYDFWLNADSMDIFPAGWCEKNNHRFHPPRGYTAANFNWSSYLRHCRAQAAPRNLFANKTGSSICPNGFRLGMKLEAVDRKNSSLVCVATVAELMDNRILVHFDSWDDIYDYWADPMSPYIHPVGWCEEHGHTLTPPNHYSKGGGRLFSWETYLKETKSVAAPARAFKQRPPSGFRRGMKLECVDKRVPMLIRVATVDDVSEHQIRIQFDGWPDQYSYWIDDDSSDIHPVGWCQKTGHPLEPPLTPEDLVETPECPTPGCRGLGHVKGAKYVTHHTAVSCPYSAQNLNKDGLIPDRILSKTDQGESKEETILKERRPAEGKNPVGRPPKWRRLEMAEESKTASEDHEWKLYDEDSSERRRKKRRLLSQEEQAAASTVKVPVRSSLDMDNLRHELRQSVMNPGYEVKPDHLSPHVWAKHSHYLNQYVQAVKSGNPNMWSVDQVAQFVWSIPDCCHIAHNFREQQIDGEALLMMAQNDLVQYMEMKLGPAIKLYNSIVLLRQRIRQS